MGSQAKHPDTVSDHDAHIKYVWIEGMKDASMSIHLHVGRGKRYINEQHTHVYGGIYFDRKH